MHVAVLDEELPFPLTSGKRIRTYHLLSRLALRHRITYLCHRNPDPDESARAEIAMRDLGIRSIVVDRRVPVKSGIGFYARLSGNLFSSLPYSVASHRSWELKAAAAKLGRDDPPDLWHCEWTPYAETLRDSAGSAPRVIMAHNVESLIWRRLAETEGNPLKRWYIRRQFRKYEDFERWAYSTSECTIAVSDEDAQRIRDCFGGQRVEVVDNGVDTGYFEPMPRVTRDSKRILFLGSLDWRPNLDAAKLLLDDIFPLVRRQEPLAQLDIVGRKPADWLQKHVARRAGVELHADVADVRPFLAAAGMLAVPLRVGGGSRLKILEALASGLPVVTSRIGVEGLHLEADLHVTVADHPEEFARAILRFMDNPEFAAQQTSRGRDHVLERYDWTGLAERLDEIWLQTARVAAPTAVCKLAKCRWD
jgi:polysaccharide biosynthesis protein PslH